MNNWEIDGDCIFEHKEIGLMKRAIQIVIVNF